MKKLATLLSLAMCLNSYAAKTEYQGYSTTSKRNNYYFDTGVSINRLKYRHKLPGMQVRRTGLVSGNDVGANFVIGKRMSKIGGELGYTTMNTQNFTRQLVAYGVPATEKLKLDNSNFFLDVNNYFYLVEDLELKTALGLGILHTNSRHSIFTGSGHEISGTKTDSDAEIKPRFGLGLQYNLDKSLSVNYDLRFQYGNDSYSSIGSTVLNLSYRFL